MLYEVITSQIELRLLAQMADEVRGGDLGRVHVVEHGLSQRHGGCVADLLGGAAVAGEVDRVHRPLSGELGVISYNFV